MRKPEEIKKALRCRSNLWYCTLYACPYYFNSCLMCSQRVTNDALDYIQQLEEQLAILKERFELMHKDFRELAARNNSGEDLMACDYCRKNFGECSCNCMKDFEWFWNDEIEQEQNNDE